MRTVFILSISSDIGLDLAERYLSLGYKVVGTYRQSKGLQSIKAHPKVTLIPCDIAKVSDIKKLEKICFKQSYLWDVFISCVGHLVPAVPFFKADFDEWADSVNVNSIAQLRVLHALYPLRRKKFADVVLFAGGGMNSAVVNLSAYTISKIMLAKMCEFIDAENHDLNIFIVGPGWTKTKIHQTILDDKRTASVKAKETKFFLKEKEGTSLQDIFDGIEWLRRQGKGVVSGRNFSIVHDPWREDKRDQLAKALKANGNMYKLRREGNAFLQ